MLKKQIITIIVVVVIVFGGIIGWGLTQLSKMPSQGPAQGEEEEEVEEVFSLSAVVSSVDVANNFLMVKPSGEEKTIKVVLSDTTKLIKLEFPFDPANPPAEATFTPIQTKIEISDFEAGDNVFIKAKENIAGKTTISNIDFVHILP